MALVGDSDWLSNSLLGQAISAPVNLLSAVSGSSVSAASGFSVPSQIYWIGALFSVPDIALFVWMVIALARRGPWAMTRVQVT